MGNTSLVHLDRVLSLLRSHQAMYNGTFSLVLVELFITFLIPVHAVAGTVGWLPQKTVHKVVLNNTLIMLYVFQ
jgi:hypothetical protein